MDRGRVRQPASWHGLLLPAEAGAGLAGDAAGAQEDGRAADAQLSLFADEDSGTSRQGSRGWRLLG